MPGVRRAGAARRIRGPDRAGNPATRARHGLDRVSPRPPHPRDPRRRRGHGRGDDTTLVARRARAGPSLIHLTAGYGALRATVRCAMTACPTLNARPEMQAALTVAAQNPGA